MTSAHTLKSYWSTLSPTEKIYKSRDIRAACSISRYVFHNWMHGITPVPVEQMNKINKAIGKTIFANAEIYEK